MKKHRALIPNQPLFFKPKKVEGEAEYIYATEISLINNIYVHVNRAVLSVTGYDKHQFGFAGDLLIKPRYM